MKLAVLCYIKKNEKILMMNIKNSHSPVNGFWNGVGGKLDVGESPEDCVRREVQEETGLVVEKMQYNGLCVFPYNGNNKEPWYVFVYTITQFSGTLIENSLEGELQWIDRDDLYKLNIQEGDKLFLPWVIDNRLFSARFLYDKSTLLDYSVDFYE